MTRQSRIKIGSFEVGNDLPLALIAGPCQMESLDHAMDLAGQLHEMTQKLGMGLVYKSSFDKANRTSIHTKRGLGMETALSVFEAVKKEFDIPVLTDVHQPEHCAEAASVVDVLQIPAFLCRQTNLLVAAAKTGKVVNIKKGQFLAPWDMKNVAEKMVESGNNQVMLTDRGTSFGYNTLVSDMRGLPTMAETGFPIVFDATHS
ncbi:MAG: 3-deoxy-8-phosphooctulonate synthase, partial [Sneathiella sp.]|nr:3-deoxy-8-phosphooctulonate synthase [Sneathiella sp.]